MTALDNISILVVGTSSVVGFLANVVFLTAIKCSSPPSLKSYSILLANCALIDLIACASTCFTIERLVAFPDMTVNVYLGPCSLISGFFCHINHSMGVHTNTASMYLIAIETCYRYYVVTRPSPSPMTVRAICITLLLPTVIATILTCLINDPIEVVREGIRVYHPEYKLDEYVFEGHIDIVPHPLSKALAIYCIGPVIPLLILVFVIIRKVINKLDEQKEVMSPKTREMHRSLVKVITLRAILPIFFFFTLFSYVLMKKNIFHPLWLEYAIGWFHHFMPTLAPVITLTNVKPYRQFVLRKSSRADVKTSVIVKHSSTMKPTSNATHNSNSFNSDKI